MSDVKDRYSQGVSTRKIESKADAELLYEIEKGTQRARMHKHEWQAVNINEIVEKFAPGAEPEFSGCKIYFYNEKRTIAVVADVGGGYLRIQDMTVKTKKGLYLNLDRTNGHNFKDEKGKIHGRNPSEYNRATHYRILTRGEM